MDFQDVVHEKRPREPLDYASPTRYPRTLAVPAMVCGSVSLPVAFLLTFITARSRLFSRSATGLVGILSLVGALVGPTVFAILVRGRLSSESSRRDRVFTVVGMLAPLAWFSLAAIAGIVAAVIIIKGN